MTIRHFHSALLVLAVAVGCHVASCSPERPRCEASPELAARAAIGEAAKSLREYRGEEKGYRAVGVLLDQTTQRLWINVESCHTSMAPNVLVPLSVLLHDTGGMRTREVNNEMMTLDSRKVLIRQGDVVSVLIHREKVQMLLQARAEQNGRLGELIRVRIRLQEMDTTTEERTLEAVVRDMTHVEVAQ